MNRLFERTNDAIIYGLEKIAALLVDFCQIVGVMTVQQHEPLLVVRRQLEVKTDQPFQHLDPRQAFGRRQEFGKATPFGGRIAHGVLTLAVATGLTNQLAIYEGTTMALMDLTVRFTGVVRFGDTVHVLLTPTEKKEHKKLDRGIVVFGLQVRNQRDETVLEGSWTCLQRRRSPAEGT